MKTLALALAVAALATTALAAEAPDGWSRPSGYYDQVKAGSLIKPVDPCPAEPGQPGKCKLPKPPVAQ